MRGAKIYNSQYILWYNILTVKLQSVIREMRSGLLRDLFLRLYFCTVGGVRSARRIWFGQQPWASCSHTYSSVTKQYNLAPVKGR